MEKDKRVARDGEFGIAGRFAIKRGVDAWGKPMIYERFDAEHGVIRSVGPNGIDEQGQGDDIQFDIPGELAPPSDKRTEDMHP